MTTGMSLRERSSLLLISFRCRSVGFRSSRESEAYMRSIADSCRPCPSRLRMWRRAFLREAADLVYSSCWTRSSRWALPRARFGTLSCMPRPIASVSCRRVFLHLSPLLILLNRTQTPRKVALTRVSKTTTRTSSPSSTPPSQTSRLSRCVLIHVRAHAISSDPLP